MAPPKKRPTKSAEDRARDAARHIEARARALEAISWLGAQGSGLVDVEALADKLGAEIVFEDLEGAKARVIQIGSRANHHFDADHRCRSDSMLDRARDRPSPLEVPMR
jgi:hypothetical protein